MGNALEPKATDGLHGHGYATVADLWPKKVYCKAVQCGATRPDV